MSLDPSRHSDTLSSDDWELVKDMVFSCLPLDRPARERWLDEQGASARVRREVRRNRRDEHQLSGQRIGLKRGLGADLGDARSPRLDVVRREVQIRSDVVNWTHSTESYDAPGPGR